MPDVHEPVADDPRHVEEATAHEEAMLAGFETCGVEPDDGPCFTSVQPEV